jgi:hypothetical protein
MFPSSGKGGGTYSVGSILTTVLSSFLNIRFWTKPKNPAILNTSSSEPFRSYNVKGFEESNCDTIKVLIQHLTQSKTTRTSVMIASVLDKFTNEHLPK